MVRDQKNAEKTAGAKQHSKTAGGSGTTAVNIIGNLHGRESFDSFKQSACDLCKFFFVFEMCLVLCVKKIKNKRVPKL